MKQFLVFTGYDQEVNGGWGDFKASFETEQEALNCALVDFQNQEGATWFEVIDLEAEKALHCGGCYVEGALRHEYEAAK